MLSLSKALLLSRRISFSTHSDSGCESQQRTVMWIWSSS